MNTKNGAEVKKGVSPMKMGDAMRSLSPLLRAGLSVLLVGAPGLGKSAIVKAAASNLDADLIVETPALGDPTDAKGLPWIGKSKKEATFLPFGNLAKALNAKKRTIFLLDDLGQATPAVQASWMQWLWSGEVNGLRLPNCVSFVAATNGRQHRANVNGILEPVKSRFKTIIHVEADLDAWTTWAIGADVPQELIGFLRFRPELFHVFEPSADMVNSPSPRTWEAVGDVLKAGVVDADLQERLFCGSVGESAAREFSGFLEFWRELPNLDGILLDPEHARISEKPSGLTATCLGLAGKASAGNIGRIIRYAERLHEAGKGEFAVHLIKESSRNDEAIQDTKAFADLATSKLGELFKP